MAIGPDAQDRDVEIHPSGPLADAIRDASAATKVQALPAALEENIQQLVEQQQAKERKRTLPMRIADAITNFSGSLAFVWLHVIWFGVWIVLNVGLIPGYAGFDPFPFGLLTMIVSLEAIFLSTFVLISQNRMQAAADRRAELDLHVNLLAEREATLILTKLARIERRLGITVDHDEAQVVEELIQPTNPADVADHLERMATEETVDAKPVKPETNPELSPTVR